MEAVLGCLRLTEPVPRKKAMDVLDGASCLSVFFCGAFFQRCYVGPGPLVAWSASPAVLVFPL